MPWISYTRTGHNSGHLSFHWLMPDVPGSEFGQAVVIAGYFHVLEALWSIV